MKSIKVDFFILNEIKMSASLHLPAAHQLTHHCVSTTATKTFDSWWQHYGVHFWPSFVSATRQLAQELTPNAAGITSLFSDQQAILQQGARKC